MKQALTNGGLPAALSRPRRWLHLASQFGAPIVGGYVFAYGFVALATLIGFALGLHFSESRSLAWMLAFNVYLIVMLWGFAARSLPLVWLVLAGGGAAMSVAAWALSQLIL